MIAHVAERSEASGRVVLELTSPRPAQTAIDAACLLARAFQSEIEALFVEDADLMALAAYPFATEISSDGRIRRTLLSDDIKGHARALARALKTRVQQSAMLANVPMRSRTVAATRLEALASLCAERGPWNVVVLADAITASCGPRMRDLLAVVSGTTGIVLVGPHARRTQGPVVLAVEHADRLPAMLRAAERLAPETGGEVAILLIGQDDEDVLWLEAEARLVLESRPHVSVGTLARHMGSSAIVAEALRLTGAGFIIAQAAGLAVPIDPRRPETGASPLSALLAALECPLFLVR